MLTEETILDEIKTLLQRFNPKNVALVPSTELVTELNIDSVAAMDIIMEIEDHFDIDVPVNEIAELRRVADLVAMVDRQKNGR